MKAFIFDMDGVIIDSEPIHFEIDVETMNYFGVTIAPHELERFVGMTNPEMWSILKEEYSLPQSVSEIIEYQLKSKIEWIRSTDLAPIEGIQELIFDLKKNNILIGLASSSPIAFINEVLRKYNFFEYFDSIISGEEVTKGKPAPDIYLEVSNQLNIKPNECWVLEDSKNGVQAAKAAGMKCIGFINQNSGNQDLSRADIIVNNIRDIKVMDLLL
ncbi:HAD family hydrolase [Paenibacillus dendritiformis]|uniref:HAD-superfamily hydrolase n=1 Tax=Paenibacillus dendritiformis C454 TaxID=1131935 RepID=H3S9C6_9BACL|nr:HAD family phosphatase [Paenibacillus dendritiformis]EHQ64374.1 HAD-superfamily hydrolase [Paenibacillus dendritiformis C454]CAH8770412.1 HAD family phosphatase [Paenibacillus dendritiformis]